MKRQKPGFSVYFTTRFINLLKSHESVIYKTQAGEWVRDVGSPHTVIILTALILLIALTLGVFYWTKYGFQLVLYSGIFLLALHRIVRYFWTSFERVDEEGKLIEDKNLLYSKRRRQRSVAFWKFAEFFGYEKPTDEFKYSKYKGWQKALIFLEALIIFSGVISLPIATANSPYSKFSLIEVNSIPWYDNPNITTIYSKDPITIDYNYGKIPLSQNANTLLQVYKEVRLYIDTFCPEAEITDYAAEQEDGTILYYFTFKNFRRGLLYKEAYKIISVDVNPDEDWMRFDYYGYHAIQNWFRPVKPPENDINMEKIIDLVLQETNLTDEDVEYYWIGTNFLIFDSQNMIDPSGDTWAVIIVLKGKQYYFTVNVAQNTIIKEDFK